MSWERGPRYYSTQWASLNQLIFNNSGPVLSSNTPRNGQWLDPFEKYESGEFRTSSTKIDMCGSKLQSGNEELITARTAMTQQQNRCKNITMAAQGWGCNRVRTSPRGYSQQVGRHAQQTFWEGTETAEGAAQPVCVWLVYSPQDHHRGEGGDKK